MNQDRDAAQTLLLSVIAYGALEAVEAQRRQERLMRRAYDLGIMADKYPAAGRVVREQWLDRYYLWLYGPPKHVMQTVTGRLVYPGVITVVTAIVMVFIGMQDVDYFLSNAMIDTTLGVTLLVGLGALLVCNLLGWRKSRERLRNWPSRPLETPEIPR